MKKIASLLLILCMLAGAACAEVEYQPLHFSFWADTAAGYEWTCEYDDNSVLDEPMEEFVENESGAGNYNYYFAVQKSGKAEIFFNYGVNYGVSMPVESIICSVNVDEAGNNTVRWAEVYSDDKMLEITLPGNMTTGWGWSYQGESEDSGMVTLVKEEYKPIDSYIEGAGGFSIYRLKVEKPGETVLMFNYSNLWEPDAAAKESYAVVVTANEDMEISISVAE